MCRNIRTLFNFEPPVTHDEIEAASLQFVRKVSGFTKPSKANEAAFNLAVARTTEAAHALLHSLVTNAPPRDRATEAARRRAKAAERFGKDAPQPRRHPASLQSASPPAQRLDREDR
jgi:hypothetical protein